MGKLKYLCSVNLMDDEVTVTTAKRVKGKWRPLEPGEKIVLYHRDSIEVEVGEGWEDDAYVWRLHPYAPNDRGDGPRFSKGEGVWQCDCASAKGVDDPLLSKLYHVTPPASAKPSHSARPKSVTLRNDQKLAVGDVDFHWLTGRIAWGEKPDDPCRHGPGERPNLPFDPEMENKSGSPPTGQILIFLRRRARDRRNRR